MVANLRTFAEKVADWFYPRTCPGCGEVSDRPGRYLCWSCFTRLELHTQAHCNICGHAAEGDVAHVFVCSVCTAAKPAFDRARSAGRFAGVLREQLHQFKYNNALWLKDDLVDLLYGCLTAHFDPAAVDVVLPVPLHPVRQRERSYNQAALLAQALACRIGRRFDNRSLVRTRKTETQTRLDAAHRRKNILGAFSVVRPEWVRGRCVLLVDDVMTTGATLNECARTLKKAGARTVWTLTAGRG